MSFLETDESFKPRITVCINASRGEEADKCLRWLQDDILRREPCQFIVLPDQQRGQLSKGTRMIIEKSDLIVLVVSHSFFESTYLLESVLTYMNNIVYVKQIPVFPVAAEDLTGAECQLLTMKGFPPGIASNFNQSDLIKKRYEEVLKKRMVHIAKGMTKIDLSIKMLCEKSVDAFVRHLENVVDKLSTAVEQGGKPRSILRITDMWRDGAVEGELVEIHGTVSKYGPLVIGDPFKKRDAHLRFRLEMEQQIDDADKAKLNALMALTAAQLVCTKELEESQCTMGLRYLGLYQSIVRNSVPLYVTNEYYQKVLAPYFGETSDCASGAYTAFDAKVVGQVCVLPWTLPIFTQFQEEIGVDIRPDALGVDEEDGSDANNDKMFGLVIGVIEGTSITYTQDTKYLDGDIWVLVDDQGETSLEARFGDLACRNVNDPSKSDIDKQKQTLLADIAQKKPGATIKFQFDRPVSGGSN